MPEQDATTATMDRPGRTWPEARCVDIKGCAAILGIGYTTMRNMRQRGEGPKPTFVVGRSPRWSIDSVHEWIRTRDAQNAAQGGRRGA